QWVRVDVLVLGDSIVNHIVEGDTVLTYKNLQMEVERMRDIDPDARIVGKPLTEGYIALQSESHPIEFRKVELFDLRKYRKDPVQLKAVLEKLRSRANRRPEPKSSILPTPEMTMTLCFMENAFICLAWIF